MFEDFTFEYLMDDTLSRAPADIDTREGSIFWDAVAGAMLKIARIYEDLEYLLSLGAVDTAVGDALDRRASEFGLTRKDAGSVIYNTTWIGTSPEEGDLFFYDNDYFTFKYIDGAFRLEANEPGARLNNILFGENAVPVNTIEGLEEIKFGSVYQFGEDVETDESLRTRIQDKVSGPAENGNKKQYETWAESITGVHQAYIYPLWNGPNTVKAVLIDSNGKGCSDGIVAEVQEYIDPADQGYTAEVNGITYVVGDGVGNGVANLGAHFTAIGAIDYNLTISFDAVVAGGYSIEDARNEAATAINSYFRELSLNYDGNSNIIIRVHLIGAILANLNSVDDYVDLRINDVTEGYITIPNDYVPNLAEVIVN